ncbi:MAG TPA: MBL fold metallo-hydrolase [Planctomycetota bacterium]|nr:MBL fold metallo-hydrolase [Planctomycetota bacterium]
MKVKFWGVRGSIPCPGVGTAKYGGNTSCIQVLGGQEVVVLDAGTGIRELGLQLMAAKKPVRVHLLITHTHWDHIQGFPFFTPIYIPGNELFIYGPRALEKSLEEALMFQMQYSYFPVRGVELAARVKFTELGEETFNIGDLEVSTKSMNHPIRVLAFKFKQKGKSVIYTGDNEPYYDVLAERARPLDTGIHRRSEFIKECNQRVVDFCRGADMLIADSQYTDQEYETKRGWGHSSISHVLELSQESAVKKLILFHHEPTHDDKELEKIERQARARGRKMKGKFKVIGAREGMALDV